METGIVSLLQMYWKTHKLDLTISVHMIEELCHLVQLWKRNWLGTTKGWRSLIQWSSVVWLWIALPPTFLKKGSDLTNIYPSCIFLTVNKEPIIICCCAIMSGTSLHLRFYSNSLIVSPLPELLFIANMCPLTTYRWQHLCFWTLLLIG